MTRLVFSLFLVLCASDHINAQWEVQFDNDNLTHIDRIFFLNENYGWAIGGATIGDYGPFFYTENGGENWFLTTDWMNRQGTDIYFINQETGFIASRNGIVKKTVNGGQTWTDIQTLSTQHVKRLFFVDDNNGWAALDNQTDIFQVLHTTDGGENWETQQVFPFNTSRIYSLYFLNDSIGFGVGGYYDVENDNSYSCIVKTINKGITWTEIYSSVNQHDLFQDIHFTDSMNGWVVGQKSTTNTYLILNTTDGGEIWEEITLPNLINWYGNQDEASIIHSIEFINDTLGWITCSGQYGSGYILLTRDAGETWEQQFVNRNFNVPIYDICAVDENTAWAVGADYIYYNNNADTIIAVNIGDFSKDNFTLSIFPNPSHDKLNVETNIFTDNRINTYFKISSILGNTNNIKFISSSNSTIDISFLPAGVYNITLYINNISVINEKFIKF